MRRTAARIFPVMAPVLLMATAFSCWVRFDLVASDALGHHVRSSLRQPEVRDELARRIARSVAMEDPRAAAAEPLIRSAAALVIESRQFADAVDIAAHLAVRTVLDGRADEATSLTDLEEQLRATVEQLDPQLAARIPAGWDTEIVDLRSTAALPRSLRALMTIADAWAVLVCVTIAWFGAWIVTAHRRRAALAVAGAGAALAGAAMLAADRFARSLVVHAADTPGARRALGAAFDTTTDGWRSISLATLVSGALVAVATTSGTRFTSLAHRVAGVGRRVGRLPDRPAGRVIWATTTAAIGIALLLVAPDAGTIVVSACGLALVFVAVTVLGQALPDSATPIRTRPAGIVAILCVIGVLAPPVVLLTVSRGSAIAGDADLRCNGRSELCDRRVDETVFVGTHNSMASADAGFLFASQTGTITEQLEGGVRSLLIDTHYGLRTQTGVVWTDLRDADRTRLEDELGADTVANVERLRSTILPPTGVPDVYLCHQFCEIGATPAADGFDAIRRFLERNPAEVIVLFIQDQTDPADTIAALQRAGLDRYAYARPPDEPWPTLGELIRAATPLIVLSERNGGETDWFRAAFREASDTTYRARTIDELTCALNRGSFDAPVLLVNAWVNADLPSIDLARQVNSPDFLDELAARCLRVRGRGLNILAVNFWREGDVLAAVDRMNEIDDDG